jgi:hypothetical protein
VKKYDVEYHCRTCEAVYYHGGDAITCCQPDSADAQQVAGTDIAATLAERGKRYGAFPKHASVSQTIKAALFDCRHRESMAADQVEALEMIAHKLGRILNGDFTYTDNVVDIIGYMQLVLDRMERANADAEKKVE